MRVSGRAITQALPIRMSIGSPDASTWSANPRTLVRSARSSFAIAIVTRAIPLAPRVPPLAVGRAPRSTLRHRPMPGSFPARCLSIRL
jgi:hypothetical protein